MQQGHKNQAGKKGYVPQGKSQSILTPGLIGAAAGVAVGSAVGIALADKKTRQKMAGTLGDLKNKAAEAFTKLTEQVDVEELRKTIGNGTHKKLAQKSKRKVH